MISIALWRNCIDDDGIPVEGVLPPVAGVKFTALLDAVDYT